MLLEQLVHFGTVALFEHLTGMSKLGLGLAEDTEAINFHTHKIRQNGAKVNPTGQLFSKKLFTKKWPIPSRKLHFSLDRIGRCPERIVRKRIRHCHERIVRIRKSLGTNDLRRAGRFSLSP